MATKPKTKVEDPEDDDDGDQDETDLVQSQEDLSVWLQENRSQGESSSVVLFRVPPKGQNTGGQLEQVWKWIDQLPDYHNDIGCVFGGGHYHLTVRLPKKDRKTRTITRRFQLGDSYTEYVQAAKLEEQAQRIPQGYAPQQPQRDPFEMMTTMMEKLILPLMAANTAQNASRPAAGGELEMLKQMTAGMGEIMTASLKGQLEMARDLRREITTVKKEDPEVNADDATEGDFKDYVKDMIKEYGPSLLEAVSGFKLQTAKTLIKNDEVFRALNADVPLFQRVTSLLLKDPDVNKELVEKVLTKLADMGLGVKLKPLPAPPPASRPPAAPQTPQAQQAAPAT